jgi:hypothetical protein
MKLNIELLVERYKRKNIKSSKQLDYDVKMYNLKREEESLKLKCKNID